MPRIKPSAIVGFELNTFGKYVCRKTDCVDRLRGPVWTRTIKASQALDGKKCVYCHEFLLPDRVSLLNGIA